jgi:preprotein translocase subunit SecG
MANMNPLFILHIVLSVMLIGCILLQAGESGLFAGGSVMSGGENFHTRRGVEKVVYYATFVLLALFVVLNIALLR